jgi:hypothetical protein
MRMTRRHEMAQRPWYETMGSVGGALTLWVTVPIVGALFFGVGGLIVGLLIAAVIQAGKAK